MTPDARIVKIGGSGNYFGLEPRIANNALAVLDGGMVGPRKSVLIKYIGEVHA